MLPCAVTPPCAKGEATIRARRERTSSAAASAQKRVGPAPTLTGRRSARRAAATTPSSPPCNPSRPSDSKYARPARGSSRAAPIPSSARAARPHSCATPSGSPATRRSRGQRASASPSAIPRVTPCASAAPDTSPTRASPPGAGAIASACPASASAPPAATVSSKRGRWTHTTIGEHMFAYGRAPATDRCVSRPQTHRGEVGRGACPLPA